jgi:hypothetical protein
MPGGRPHRARMSGNRQPGPPRLGGAPPTHTRRGPIRISPVTLVPPVHISYVPCAEPDKSPPKSAPSVGKVSAVHDHPTPMLMVRVHPGTSGRLRGRPDRERCLHEGAVGTGRAPQLTRAGWVPRALRARYGAGGGGLAGRGGCRGRRRRRTRRAGRVPGAQAYPIRRTGEAHPRRPRRAAPRASQGQPAPPGTHPAPHIR